MCLQHVPAGLNKVPPGSLPRILRPTAVACVRASRPVQDVATNLRVQHERLLQS